ncbi:DnaJ domain-containing protein [Nannocystis sp. ILAH1]|uniref:DnaJ domain-containing protein n=1 Tax=Nannocystis sp. ILAH1 TaxID=2996789 RepID=UPI00226EA4B7|nr:DnaJ domain-containing protein [Nannocystis sp. ILAH1]MCY0994692.1 DnaJ domain-containing protein [Nannocystis sp. ILAH1]
MQLDPYQELGVARDASDEDIKRAFRRRILQTHPDRKQEPGASDEAFRRAKDAFEAIMRERAEGGDLPPWAADLMDTWGRARDAARRGDFGVAAEEVQVLVGAVAEQVERVSTTTQVQYQEVRRTVRALSQLFSRATKGRARRRSS